MTPQCPICSGTNVAKSRGPRPFDCLTCNTLFDGSDEERAANQENRIRYSAHRLTVARLRDGTEAPEPVHNKPARRLRVVPNESEKP